MRNAILFGKSGFLGQRSSGKQRELIWKELLTITGFAGKNHEGSRI